jgi:hypothetical protein
MHGRSHDDADWLTRGDADAGKRSWAIARQSRLEAQGGTGRQILQHEAAPRNRRDGSLSRRERVALGDEDLGTHQPPAPGIGHHALHDRARLQDHPSQVEEPPTLGDLQRPDGSEHEAGSLDHEVEGACWDAPGPEDPTIVGPGKQGALTPVGGEVDQHRRSRPLFAQQSDPRSGNRHLLGVDDPPSDRATFSENDLQIAPRLARSQPRNGLGGGHDGPPGERESHRPGRRDRSQPEPSPPIASRDPRRTGLTRTALAVRSDFDFLHGLPGLVHDRAGDGRRGLQSQGRTSHRAFCR